MGTPSPESKEKVTSPEESVQNLVSQIVKLLKEKGTNSSICEHTPQSPFSPKTFLKIFEFSENETESLWLGEDKKWYYRLYHKVNTEYTCIKQECIGSSIEDILRRFIEIKFPTFTENSWSEFTDQIGDHIRKERANILQEIKTTLEDVLDTLKNEDISLAALLYLIWVTFIAQIHKLNPNKR